MNLTKIVAGCIVKPQEQSKKLFEQYERLNNVDSTVGKKGGSNDQRDKG